MPIRDDVTPTNPEPIEVLAAQLEALRKHPEDADLYFELRVALRKSGQAEPIADIGELHAPFENDRLKAADIWSEAGEARLLLGHDEQGERDLRSALGLDPANERAAARIAELLMVAERFAEAATVLEEELSELERRADLTPPNKRRKSAPFAARRGHRHRMLAQLWDERLGRVDRALHHWQQAWQLEPDRSDALECARAIYASLGDEKMVARLYEAELDVLSSRGPRPRRAKLELELGLIMSRLGEMAGAASHLETALTLAPKSDEAREALAEVYASPSFDAKDGRQRRASELFVELGRRRLTSKDEDRAIGYLRRALGVDPYSRDGINQLERALAKTQRWEELDRLYRHIGDLVEDPRQREEILIKRGKLYEQHFEDPEPLKEVLLELSTGQPIGSPYIERLRLLYREGENWKELADLIDREIQVVENDPAQVDFLCKESLELATILREHLGDQDRAAEQLHRVLSVQPHNEEAQARYADHFRERRDWRGLADLLEFGIDNAHDAGASAEELIRRMEELSQVAELRLGDIDRAIAVWQRILRLDPTTRKAREALRRLASRAKMWESLVGVLEQEAASAPTPQHRADALRRIAQVYRERQVNPRKAIALYEEVLAMFPSDEAVLKSLTELNEREGDEAGLAHTLRRRLDLDVSKMNTDLQASGRRAPTAREWPVAKRVERLTTLRRLATMYETRLADVEGVVYACGGILEILPGDRDALDRMERVLEQAGDVERLEQTLEYHAESSTGPAERAKVLRRLARLAAERDDEVSAMERWEKLLKAAPSDSEALGALGLLYERHERWAELAQVLERSLMSPKTPEQGSPEAAIHAEELRRYARVVDDKLSDRNRALRAWRKVLELMPKDRETLAALSRTYEEAGRWRDLAEVLAVQAPLYIDTEPKRAAEVALKRATLLEERLGAPAEASKALEALLSDLDPSNLSAHQTLRRLYEARGDFEAAVRIAEREMFLSDDTGQQIARGLEIGLLCRDRLADPTRALQAFERVLDLQGDHEEALTAAADLYAKVGDWKNHIRTLERRIDMAAEGRDRRAILMRIAQATADRLKDHKGAFRWFRKAHEHAPDASTIAELRRAAEAYGLWRELAEVYARERESLLEAGGGESPLAVDVPAFVSASRELATIAERRLNDRRRALSVLLDTIRVSPHDDGLMSEAERIALEANTNALWTLLLECMSAAIDAGSRAERVALHSRRARILEERLDDTKGAVAELLKAFSWLPEREETREALYQLAERTHQWNDLVAVETALLERADSDATRVTVLHRKAQLIDEKLHDKVRAFRTQLQAFLVNPEHGETVAHVWRLARAIGQYREADRKRRVEPAPAYVAPPEEPTRAARRLLPGLRVDPSKPGREPTQEITIGDLIVHDEDFDEADAIPKLAREDQTMPIDLSEIEIDESADDKKPRDDATMELRTEDLIQALGSRAIPPPPGPPKSSPHAARTKGPPAPPPRPPKITKHPPRRPSNSSPSTAKPAEKRRRALKLPERSYDSPWEEFATAYELLPTPDNATRLKWLFRSAEVWETGAEDTGKAFDMLAHALELADEDDEPRARLYRLANDHDAWDRLARLYEEAAEAADTADSAVNLLSEVAEIRSKQGRPLETETLYRRILGMRPESVSTREKLESLYRGESRWVDLAASLEERTDARLGTAAPEPERSGLLRELASIYSDKLDRPHDAIDSLNRLRALDPEGLDTLQQLADLYGRIDRWSKVIEMLGRIADIAEVTTEAREAMHRIASIYESELELPDRAIESYAHVVATWPDDTAAYAKLDQLYQDHARWEELSETLRRRAALTREPGERAALLQRRAQVLMEWMDAPEDAAAALRHARTLAPDKPEISDALVQALIKAGREREAAAVLEGRIAAAKQGGGGAGDTAALLIRLAQLRAEHLGDHKAARAVLDEALALVPDHPTALSTLARLAEAEEDPRAFAEAKLREADARTDVDAKVEALLAAGSTLRDRCEDVPAARGAFERVLELRPYHSAATWALAGLVEHEGDLESATALLEKRLDDASLEPEEKTRILTQLAALAKNAGVPEAAERRLEEALTTTPSHLPAVLARADLMSEAGHFEDLQMFILEMLPELEHTPAAARSELQRRLAIAYEELGESDKAYQTLLAADRLHRGNLLVKLALGENRYRARRWREAALHLGAVADHELAADHPAEIAEGLYHAALAEIRSLRPEKAVALYERALELKPNYAPALHALAEVAMDQGDPRRAADLLTRQATATEDPSERMRLFEALGDMALMTLGDEQRARVCYESAVQAADPLEAKHLPLLEKLLERQDLASDSLGAARTAELMASFGDDARARASRYTAAAENYLAAGEDERARAAAERAVDADPYHLTGVTVLSDLMMQEEQFEAAAATLGRALSGGDDDAVDELAAPRKAQLWRRLAEARRQRGDLKGAISAFEKCIAVAPESDSAIGARRELITLLEKDSSKSELLLEYRRTIAADTRKVDDLLAYAYALRSSDDASGACAVMRLAEALGHGLSEAEQLFLAANAPQAMDADAPYKSSVSREERAALIADEDDAGLGEVVSLLWESAALLWSESADALERCGVVDASRVSATASFPAAAMFPRIAAALDIPATMLYVTDVPDAPDVQLVCVSPPVIVLGPRLQALDDEALTAPELRFLLGRAAELSRPSRIISAGLPTADRTNLLGSLARVFGSEAVRKAAKAASHDEGADKYHDELLRTTLPVKLRSRLDEIFTDRSTRDLDVNRYMRACNRAADRAGLLVSGSIGVAMQHAGDMTDDGRRRTRHLVALSLSPGYLALRRKLGVGVKK